MPDGTSEKRQLLVFTPFRRSFLNSDLDIVESDLTGVNSALDAAGMPGVVRVEGKESGSR